MANKSYQLNLTVLDPKVTTGAKGRVVSMFHKREGKKDLRCVGFEKMADAILALVGQTKKVWGYYETRKFTGQDGQEHTVTEFQIRGFVEPKAETAPEAAAA